ncbi:MAG: helix-turn-helix domain-containing protein [Lysobacter sp.]
MAALKRERDPYTDLLRELTSAIVLKTGTREQIAMQYASAAMECLQDRKAANGSVYVGAAPRQYDILQIRAALERGASIGEVCRDFGLARRTLYRMFPGGLPTPNS